MAALAASPPATSAHNPPSTTKLDTKEVSSAPKARRRCNCSQQTLYREYPDLEADSQCPVCTHLKFTNAVSDHPERDVIKPAPPIDYTRHNAASVSTFAKILDEVNTSVSTLSINKRRFDGVQSAQLRVKEWALNEIPWLRTEYRNKIADDASQQLKAVWDTHAWFVVHVDYDENTCHVDPH